MKKVYLVDDQNLLPVSRVIIHSLDWYSEILKSIPESGPGIVRLHEELDKLYLNAIMGTFNSILNFCSEINQKGIHMGQEEQLNYKFLFPILRKYNDYLIYLPLAEGQGTNPQDTLDYGEERLLLSDIIRVIDDYIHPKLYCEKCRS